MKKSEQINELAAALSKAQAEMPEAKKDKVNTHFKNKYSSLTAIWEAGRLPLSKNNLSVVQSLSTPSPGLLNVTTLLMHTSGQWIEGELVLPLDKNTAQSAGSTATYARRYALSGFIGATSDEDTDGQSAGEVAPIKNDTPIVSVPSGSMLIAPKAATHLTVESYVVPFGKKHKNRRIKEIPLQEIASYKYFLENPKDGKPVSKEALEFIHFANIILNEASLDQSGNGQTNEPKVGYSDDPGVSDDDFRR